MSTVMSWSSFWISGFVLQLLFQPLPPAAAAAADLTCRAHPKPDGSVQYYLSQAPRSPSCDTNWEDHDKTVVAQGSNYSEDLVQHLTNQSITMRACRDYLHYTRDCFGVWEDAVCRVNCSLLVIQDPPPSTLKPTCFLGCPDKSNLALGISSVLLLLAGAFVCLWFWRKRRSAAMTASYTAAAPQEDIV